MTCCGPKCSLCGVLLSAWGVIQLTLMGVFFYIKSVALVEDMAIPPFHKLNDDIDEVYREADELFVQNAYNCWIAAGIYALLLVLSVQQLYANARKQAI